MKHLIFILTLIVAQGCADILCVNTPARIPPYQDAILSHPNQRLYFNEYTISEARRAKQVLVFPNDMPDENVSGFFMSACPYQYSVLSEYILPVDERWGSYDASLGCQISAHELTHAMLYFEKAGFTDHNHTLTHIWNNMDLIAKEVCVPGSSSGWEDGTR